MPSSLLNINGARLYYEESGQGFPVVFVHAGIADHRMWDEQFPVISQKYRAIRFDMRGYGHSKMVAGPYSPVNDLYELLRTLDVKKAALVGCSMGGSAIIDFALLHPEMTAALVPVGSGLSGFDYQGDPPEVVEEMEAAYKAGDMERLNELTIHLWLDGISRQPQQVDPQVRQKVLEMNRIALQTPPDLGQPQFVEPPAAGRLGEISIPTLVIYGDLDLPDIRNVADQLGREIPNVRVVAMTGTAHLPNMERPEEFNQLLVSFLKVALEK